MNDVHLYSGYFPITLFRSDLNFLKCQSKWFMRMELLRLNIHTLLLHYIPQIILVADREMF